MGAARSLGLLAIGCMAWLAALPAVAEEEHHKEDSKPRTSAPSSSPSRTPPVSAVYSGPSRAPQVQGNSGGNSRDTSDQSIGFSILNDLLFGSSSSSSSNSYSSNSYSDASSASASASNTDLHSQLNERGIASYAGLGLGKSIAYYPLNSSSDTALKIFGGFRTKYIGAELGANFLSTISTTVNSQAVDVSTDAYSLALLGYLPLNSNADFYLRYGGVYWDVNARSNSGSNMPVQSGFNRVRGFGIEFRSERYFLRVEKDFYRQIYQSSFYTYVGASFGAYIE